MTDVLKIALERRSKLQEEVDNLDEFIRMAETLISGGDKVAAAPQNAAVKAAVAEAEESPMRAAARRLTETEPRRAPEPQADADTPAAESTDVPRPSIIRRGLAG